MNIRLTTVAAVLSATLAATAAFAQSSKSNSVPDSSARWSLLIPSGKLVPTGSLRHTIQRGDISAAQIAFAIRPNFAVTSTFGWARSRDIATVDDPKLDVFTYDVGLEARAPRWLEANAMTVEPFAGVGAGGRSYNHRKLDVDATHNVAGYVSAGADVRIRRVGLRFETRDYVTEFKPLAGTGDKRAANDVVVMVGLRLFSR
jgi:hypothetical protein